MKHQAMRLTTAIALALAVGTAAATGASDVTRATLDNGLRVVIVRDTLAPVVMTGKADSDRVSDSLLVSPRITRGADNLF